MSITPDLLAALAPLIGTWQITGAALDAAGREAAAIRGTGEYAWLPGGEWLIHRDELLTGAIPTSTIEMIGDYDAVRDRLVARAFDSAGELETLSVARLADGAWRFAGDDARGTLRPAPDRPGLAAYWERRADDGTWTPWMHLRYAPADPTRRA